MTKLDIGILILVGLSGISCFRVGFTRSVWGVFVIGVGFFRGLPTLASIGDAASETHSKSELDEMVEHCRYCTCRLYTY